MNFKDTILSIFSLSESPNKPPIKKATLFGLIFICIFLFIFIVWGALSNLEAGATAFGKVIVAGNRKTVQHLSGGTIEKIYIKEGSVVKKGDLLIKLESMDDQASYDIYHSAVNNLLANEARLIALKDQDSSITFPKQLLKEQIEPAIAKLIESQKQLFTSQQNAFKGQVEVLKKRIEQLNIQIISYNSQITAIEGQLKLINEELNAMLLLDKEHLVEKPKIWALKREVSRLTGNREELVGSIAQTKEKIGETQQQQYSFQDNYYKDILEKLTATQDKLSENLEKEIAADDKLKHTKILAPIGGMIINLQEHTEGGVIQPGKDILDIVPSHDDLVVEAKINSLHIASVHTGLKAKVQLVAYKRRNTPDVDGVVNYVSPDSLEDKENHASYYLAYIKIPSSELARLPGIILYPGMPVEVLIIIDKRTPLNYFLSPIRDSFNRAFREK